MNQPVSISRVSRLFATFLAIALVAGCGDGPSLAKVTGKITVNGKPAVGATLLFHPVDVKDAPVATGVADNDGKFTLTLKGGVSSLNLAESQVSLEARRIDTNTIVGRALVSSPDAALLASLRHYGALEGGKLALRFLLNRG